MDEKLLDIQDRSPAGTASFPPSRGRPWSCPPPHGAAGTGHPPPPCRAWLPRQRGHRRSRRTPGRRSDRSIVSPAWKPLWNIWRPYVSVRFQTSLLRPGSLPGNTARNSSFTRSLLVLTDASPIFSPTALLWSLYGVIPLLFTPENSSMAPAKLLEKTPLLWLF